MMMSLPSSTPIIRTFQPPDIHWMREKTIACLQRNDVQVNEISYTESQQFIIDSDRIDRQHFAPLDLLDVIDDDGNCGFRCISLMLTGSDQHYDIIKCKLNTFIDEKCRRNELLRELRSSVAFCGIRHDDSSDSRMSVLHLYGAAAWLNCTIYLKSENGWSTFEPTFIDHCNLNITQNESIPSFILTVANNHFQLASAPPKTILVD